MAILDGLNYKPGFYKTLDTVKPSIKLSYLFYENLQVVTQDNVKKVLDLFDTFIKYFSYVNENIKPESIKKSISSYTTINLIPLKNFKSHKDTSLPIFKIIEDCLKEDNILAYVNNTDFNVYCTDNLCLNTRELLKAKYSDLCPKKVSGRNTVSHKKDDKGEKLKDRKTSPDMPVQSIKTRKEMSVLINEFFEENGLRNKNKNKHKKVIFENSNTMNSIDENVMTTNFDTKSQFRADEMSIMKIENHNTSMNKTFMEDIERIEESISPKKSQEPEKITNELQTDDKGNKKRRKKKKKGEKLFDSQTFDLLKDNENNFSIQIHPNNDNLNKETKAKAKDLKLQEVNAEEIIDSSVKELPYTEDINIKDDQTSNKPAEEVLKNVIGEQVEVRTDEALPNIDNNIKENQPVDTAYENIVNVVDNENIVEEVIIVANEETSSVKIHGDDKPDVPTNNVVEEVIHIENQVMISDQKNEQMTEIIIINKNSDENIFDEEINTSSLRENSIQPKTQNERAECEEKSKENTINLPAEEQEIQIQQECNNPADKNDLAVKHEELTISLQPNTLPDNTTETGTHTNKDNNNIEIINNEAESIAMNSVIIKENTDDESVQIILIEQTDLEISNIILNNEVIDPIDSSIAIEAKVIQNAQSKQAAHKDISISGLDLTIDSREEFKPFHSEKDIVPINASQDEYIEVQQYNTEIKKADSKSKKDKLQGSKANANKSPVTNKILLKDLSKKKIESKEKFVIKTITQTTPKNLDYKKRLKNLLNSSNASDKSNGSDKKPEQNKYKRENKKSKLNLETKQINKEGTKEIKNDTVATSDIDNTSSKDRETKKQQHNLENSKQASEVIKESKTQNQDEIIKEEKIGQKIEHKAEEKVQERIEDKLEQNIEQYIELNIEQKAEQNLEQNTEQKAEQKSEENIEQNIEQNIKQKSEENIEKKLEEKTEEKKGDFLKCENTNNSADIKIANAEEQEESLLIKQESNETIESISQNKNIKQLVINFNKPRITTNKQADSKRDDNVEKTIEIPVEENSTKEKQPLIHIKPKVNRTSHIKSKKIYINLNTTEESINNSSLLNNTAKPEEVVNTNNSNVVDNNAENTNVEADAEKNPFKREKKHNLDESVKLYKNDEVIPLSKPYTKSRSLERINNISKDGGKNKAASNVYSEQKTSDGTKHDQLLSNSDEENIIKEVTLIQNSNKPRHTVNNVPNTKLLEKPEDIKPANTNIHSLKLDLNKINKPKDIVAKPTIAVGDAGSTSDNNKVGNNLYVKPSKVQKPKPKEIQKETPSRHTHRNNIKFRSFLEIIHEDKKEYFSDEEADDIKKENRDEQFNITINNELNDITVDHVNIVSSNSSIYQRYLSLDNDYLCNNNNETPKFRTKINTPENKAKPSEKFNNDENTKEDKIQEENSKKDIENIQIKTISISTNKNPNNLTKNDGDTINKTDDHSHSQPNNPKDKNLNLNIQYFSSKDVDKKNNSMDKGAKVDTLNIKIYKAKNDSSKVKEIQKDTKQVKSKREDLDEKQGLYSTEDYNNISDINENEEATEENNSNRSKPIHQNNTINIENNLIFNTSHVGDSRLIDFNEDIKLTNTLTPIKVLSETTLKDTMIEINLLDNLDGPSTPRKLISQKELREDIDLISGIKAANDSSRFLTPYKEGGNDTARNLDESYIENIPLMPKEEIDKRLKEVVPNEPLREITDSFDDLLKRLKNRVNYSAFNYNDLNNTFSYFDNGGNNKLDESLSSSTYNARDYNKTMLYDNDPNNSVLLNSTFNNEQEGDAKKHQNINITESVEGADTNNDASYNITKITVNKTKNDQDKNKPEDGPDRDTDIKQPIQAQNNVERKSTVLKKLQREQPQQRFSKLALTKTNNFYKDESFDGNDNDDSEFIPRGRNTQVKKSVKSKIKINLDNLVDKTISYKKHKTLDKSFNENDSNMSMDIISKKNKIEFFQQRDTSFTIIQPRKGRHPIIEENNPEELPEEGNCGSCLGNDNNCIIY
jgi:hypothetical protein